MHIKTVVRQKKYRCIGTIEGSPESACGSIQKRLHIAAAQKRFVKRYSKIQSGKFDGKLPMSPHHIPTQYIYLLGLMAVLLTQIPEDFQCTSIISGTQMLSLLELNNSFILMLFFGFLSVRLNRLRNKIVLRFFGFIGL